MSQCGDYEDIHFYVVNVFYGKVIAVYFLPFKNHPVCAITCIGIASAVLLGRKISFSIQETRMGVVGVGRLAMGVRLIWYGCQPVSMGVSTPTVEYNSPPMAEN